MGRMLQQWIVGTMTIALIGASPITGAADTSQKRGKPISAKRVSNPASKRGNTDRSRRVEKKQAQPSVELSGRDKAQQNLRQVRQQIDVLAQQVEKNKKEYRTASKVLERSERAIAESNRSLKELQTQYQTTQQSLTSLKNEIRRTDQSIRQSQSVLASLFRQQYIQSRQTGLVSDVVMDPWNQIARNRESRYLSYIARAQSRRIQMLRGEEAQKARLVKAKEGAVESLAQIHSREQEEQKVLQQELLERKRAVNTLSQQLGTQQARLKALKRDEAQLSNVVRKITRQIAAQEKERQQKLAAARREAARKREEAKKREAALAADTTSGRSGASRIADEGKDEKTISGLDDAYGNVSFSQLKGRLNYPVIGHVMNRFGEERSDTGSRWKGVFIQAPAGAMIRTLAPGRVVFADWMRGYGNLLIVDHGQGYLSIYGHNETLLRKAGDAVKIGDAIATVGNSGGIENFGLYLELRHQDSPIDPIQWMQKG